MNILFLSSWFPYPPNNGSKIRAYNLLRALARRHAVTLLTFIDATDTADTSGLEGICRVTGVVPRPVYNPGGLRAVAGFFSPRPRHIVDTYSAQMSRLIQDELRRTRYDVAIASEATTAAYATSLAGTPAVFEDVELAIIRDQYMQSPPGLARLRRWLTWQKTRRYTAQLARRFAACTVVSEQERAYLSEATAGYQPVTVIANGVDTSLMTPGMASAHPHALVYNGALTYGANYDAMRYFLADIWPQIRAQVPGASLKITGRTDGVDVAGLPVDEHVTFTGYLADIRPTVARSAACVVPLRIGGGTRLKILEAMALGTPVVATSKGAEGLAVTPEVDILIADDPARFAAHTVRLLSDAELRRRLAENGRRLVESRYSWQTIGEQFTSLVEAVARTEHTT